MPILVQNTKLKNTNSKRLSQKLVCTGLFHLTSIVLYIFFWEKLFWDIRWFEKQDGNVSFFFPFSASWQCLSKLSPRRRRGPKSVPDAEKRSKIGKSHWKFYNTNGSMHADFIHISKSISFMDQKTSFGAETNFRTSAFLTYMNRMLLFLFQIPPKSSGHVLAWGLLEMWLLWL